MDDDNLLDIHAIVREHAARLEANLDGRPSVGPADLLLERLYEVHKHPRYDFWQPPK